MKHLLVLFLLALSGAALAEVTATDDAGKVVRLVRPAARIVSLSPHVTELLFAAGAGERVVAAVEYSDHPEAAKRLPHIGSYAALDLERIATIEPDLAVAWGSGNPPAQVAQLARLGIPVFVSEPKKLEDIPATLRRLGQLTASAAAETAARDFERRHAALREKYAGRRSVPIFYEIWNRPLMTIGGDHVISAAITLCGGRNVFAQLTQPAEAVELEAVLRANPEAIVSGGMEAVRREWLEQWRRWPQLTAVKRGNLFVVPPDLLQRHTPRLLDGAAILCEALEAARQRSAQTGK
jgi:iron complex transport system substrate-binding protein